jgi:type IV pilus assembly protein PilW
MKPYTFARESRHRGFTLIEVMIALTIGMALTLVVSMLFINSRRTYATTDDVSRMQENIRYTYQLLTRMVHFAGHKSSPNAKTEAVFGVGNEVLTTIDTGGTASDTVTIRFEGSSNGTAGVADGTVVDCLGNPIAGGVTAVNTFSIGVIAPNTVPGLLCAVGGGAPVEVVPNVSNMQILYGVDDDVNLVADRYVAGGAAVNGFENPLVQPKVRSIRFAFLFTSPTASALLSGQKTLDKSGNSIDRVFDLNGVSVGPFDDHFLRRAVTMTISMRNRTP